MKHTLAMLLIAVVGTAAATAQGRLVISELLYQPTSGEAEYIELYNPCDTAVDLQGYHIVRVLHDTLSTHYALPPYMVGAHDYVVLSSNTASVLECFNVRYATKVVECRLPAYPNGGGSVVIALSDSTVVERFDYSPAMQSALLRNKAGVALERCRFDRPANEASNWHSAASTVGYGTPTYQNSQSTERLALETDFDFGNGLLSPNADGYCDGLEIAYQIDTTGLYATADIFDAGGRLVRRLLTGALLGTQGTIGWDCTNQAGHTVPRGQYIVQITLYNTYGTRQVIRRTVAVL